MRLGRILAVVALIGFAPAIARSSDLPALFDVTGVAADDVLNVRAAPEAGADKIGALSHDARDVEVIRAEDGWGQINLGEQAGWVSLRFLARQEGGDYALTREFSCFGTEPFWTLAVTQGVSARLSTPSGLPLDFSAGLLQSATGRTDRYFLQGVQPNAEPGFAAVVRRAACDDGMSDRAFGLDVDLLLDMPGGAVMLSGCCSLTAGP